MLDVLIALFLFFAGVFTAICGFEKSKALSAIGVIIAIVSFFFFLHFLTIFTR